MEKFLRIHNMVLVTMVSVNLSTSTLPSTCVPESSLNHSLVQLVSATSLEQVLAGEINEISAQ